MSTAGRTAQPMAMTQTGSQVPHLSPTDGRGALGRRGAESHHDMKVVWWQKALKRQSSDLQLHPFATMDVSCFGRGLVGPTLSATEIRQASAGSVGRPHFCHFFWWFWTATIYIDACLCCIVSSQFVHLWADWRIKGEQSRQTTSNGYLEVCVKCSSSLHIWGRNSHYFGKILI